VTGVAALRRAAYADQVVTGPGFLVSDTFTRANGAGLGNADTGQAWNENGTAWIINANAAHPPNVVGFRFATINPAAADVDIRVTIDPSNAGGIDLGVIARWADANNHILFNITQSAGVWLCRAFEKVGGGGYSGVTTLQNPVPGLGAADYSPFRARIRTAGTAGEVFLTSQADLNTWVSMGTWTINAALTGTVAGFAGSDSNANAFDDLTIAAA
jgi:hypothetical protein